MACVECICCAGWHWLASATHCSTVPSSSTAHSPLAPLLSLSHPLPHLPPYSPSPTHFPSCRFTFVVRAFSVLDGIGKGLDAKFDISEIAKPYALELLRFREVGTELFFKDLKKRWDRQSQAFRNLLRQPSRVEKLADVILRLEQGDLKLRVRTLENERAFKRVATMQNTIGSAIAAATLVNVASAMHIAARKTPATVLLLVSAVPVCVAFFTMSASQEEAHGTTARRLDVIDLDQVIARVPAHNTPLNANDDTLAYFDAGEVDCDVEDTADEDTDPAMATDRFRLEPYEVMQRAWIRHDYDAQYRGQTRLQGQNREVMLFEKLRERHPEFRHKLATVKAKVFLMEAQYRHVGDLLLNDSGKGRPPKIPIFYDIFDRILGDRANARPPALAGSLPGANVVNLPSTSTTASK
ncbi:unnamed protein product [Closterium sp. NIES-53]